MLPPVVAIRIEHSTGGYLRFAENRAPDVALNHGVWHGGKLPRVRDVDFTELANGIAQLWKQEPNWSRRQYTQDAVEEAKNPPAWKYDDDEFEPFSARQVHVLLRELEKESMHEWNCDEEEDE